MDNRDFGNNRFGKIPAVFLLGMLLFLVSCSRPEGEKKILYEYSRRPAEHFYAYTTEIPDDIRNAVEDRFRHGGFRIGYLMPVRMSESGKKELSGQEFYWCTLYNNEGDLAAVVQVNVDVTDGGRRVDMPGYDGPINSRMGVDWEGLAGYTSQSAPMTLWRQAIYTYMVIGDTAYSLNLLPGRELQETDGYSPDTRNRTVRDILHLP